MRSRPAPRRSIACVARARFGEARVIRACGGGAVRRIFSVSRLHPLGIVQNTGELQGFSGAERESNAREAAPNGG